LEAELIEDLVNIHSGHHYDGMSDRLSCVNDLGLTQSSNLINGYLSPPGRRIPTLKSVWNYVPHFSKPADLTLGWPILFRTAPFNAVSPFDAAEVTHPRPVSHSTRQGLLAR
jgi:hypothetical protein